MSLNKMHYVYIENDGDYFNLKWFFDKIIEKYPKIELKYGDFIENGYESGYRCKGVYIVNKNKKNELSIIFLEDHMDDYGTIPENFISFKDFEPGYHFEMEIPSECKSYMHNNYVPLSLSFLRQQTWIEKGTEKDIKKGKTKFVKQECSVIYNNKKYLIIRDEFKYLHKLKDNNKIIYGEIYMKEPNKFDSYEQTFTNEIEYGNYDRIILI